MRNRFFEFFTFLLRKMPKINKNVKLFHILVLTNGGTRVKIKEKYEHYSYLNKKESINEI